MSMSWRLTLSGAPGTRQVESVVVPGPGVIPTRATEVTPGTAPNSAHEGLDLRAVADQLGIVDEQQPRDSVAGIDGARVERLRIDDRGADDERDRDRELQDDEAGSQPSRAGRVGGALIGLEHQRRPVAGEEEGGIDAAHDAHDGEQAGQRQDDAVRSEIADRDAAVDLGVEPREGELDQSDGEQSRRRDDHGGFDEELGDELAARRPQGFAQPDLARPAAGAGGGEIGEIDAGDDQQEGGDDPERDERLDRRAEPHGRAIDRGRVDGADVHQLLGEAEAVGSRGIALGGGDEPPQGGVHPAVQSGGVDAGAQTDIDPARHPVPLGESLVARRAAGEVGPIERGDAQMGVGGQVAQDSGDPCDLVPAAGDPGHRPAQHVGAAEQAPGRGFGENDGVDGGKGGGGIARDQRQTDHVQEIAVGEIDVLDGDRLAVLAERAAGGDEPGRRFDFGELPRHRLRRDERRLGVASPGGGPGRLDALDLVGALGLRQPIVEAQLVADEEDDQEAAGQAYGEACQVDRGEQGAAPKRLQADGEIIAQHGRLPPYS